MPPDRGAKIGVRLELVAQRVERRAHLDGDEPLQVLRRGARIQGDRRPLAGVVDIDIIIAAVDRHRYAASFPGRPSAPFQECVEPGRTPADGSRAIQRLPS
jgi:hypothetical protein